MEDMIYIFRECRSAKNKIVIPGPGPGIRNMLNTLDSGQHGNDVTLIRQSKNTGGYDGQDNTGC